MQELVDKAAVLLEALPYIRSFHGQTFVIKYGGNAMVDPALRDSFARDVVLMKYVGLHPVVVHGGGPQIDQMLAEVGVQTQRVDGFRITDDKAMEIVEMVLGAKVNKEIVSLIGNHGGRAIGLTGRDDSLLRAVKLERMQTQAGTWIDPGRVGRIETVNADVVRRLVDAGFLPVIAPVALDHEGRSLNINADTAAGEVAKALGASKLVLMTDVQGVKNAAGDFLSSISASEIQQMKKDAVIAGGMIPKVDCALDAIRGGVQKAHIIDGRRRHAVLLEIFTDVGVGTQITG